MTKSSETAIKTIQRIVTIKGIADIMFDRYPGDNRTQLEPFQKLYLNEKREICLPAMNLVSALTAENTNSFPRIIMDKRKYKDFSRAVLSYTTISPQMLNLTREGKPIVLGNDLSEDLDKESGTYIHRTVARLPKGIPNPKARPVVPLPWEIKFELTMFPNQCFKEQELKNIISQGGLSLGIGTFRGVFGKFLITAWE